ncbi:MAG: Gfo/Idh/MocA family oxidoreductase [Planctomycetales bacterium]|nr:Gfo/Idh/MocA family oxidoreductase [Planctomycetales bacterium]
MSTPTGKPASSHHESSANSRRRFIRDSSWLVVGGTMASNVHLASAMHADGSDEIKVGLIGCGARGTGAANQMLSTPGATKIVAMGDVFADRLQACIRGLSRNREKVDVPKERQFVGFDAYEKVLQTDCDLVILATPPGFRPLHAAAAIQAGKHVFAEKPVAVDAPGVRQILETARLAKEKNLAFAVGLQRRHEPRYQETVARLQTGAIGDIVLARCYWNGGGVWTRARQENQTELEFQLRNWYYFTWLSGDHIVEQHVHNLDVINWLKQSYPVVANGQGGRQVRQGPEYGQIYDHHFVEFTYEDGTKLFSQCRHIENCWNSVTEHVHGTQGTADISGARIKDPAGNTVWEYGKGGGKGWQEEQHQLLGALRAGNVPNEGEYAALSTLTAILGRTATYSGKSVRLDDIRDSKQTLADVAKLTDLDAKPPVQPNDDGSYPVAMPGSTKVV